MSNTLKSRFCGECKRFVGEDHTVDECIVAQIHEEENELAELFDRLDKAPLRPTTFFMPQQDLDDIIEWTKGNR